MITCELNPVEPAPLSLRHPTGLPLELDIRFRKRDGSPVDPTSLNPQLVLIPRSAARVYAYDVTTTDAAGGIGNVKVPGNGLNDRNAYGLELYSRDPANVPTVLLAMGVLRLVASGYTSLGPLGPMTVPVIEGPQGAQGPQGQRGSVWFDGSGDPDPSIDALPGDMYLDQATGDVWRYDGTMWRRGTF